MKRKVTWLLLCLLVISAMLLASCGSSNSSSTASATSTTSATSGTSTTSATSATTKTNAATINVTYGSVTKSYSMADMQTLLTYFGYGGPRNPDGSVNKTPDYLYTAIALTDVIKGTTTYPGVEPGGLTAGQSVKIIGANGSSITYTYDQITNGNFPTYNVAGVATTPTPTTATVPVIAILYWANGNGLDAATGPFELGICYGQPLLTDASNWIKSIYEIDVISGS